MKTAIAIDLWFQELRDRKIAVDGVGFEWPEGSAAWVPREKYPYEDLYAGNSMLPNVPYYLSSAYYNDGNPHQVYHAWFGDEGREGVLLRSEIQILLRCIRGRMSDHQFHTQNVPV